MDDGPFCWCGHAPDRHDINFGVPTCLGCLLDDDTGEANPHHGYEEAQAAPSSTSIEP
jgi:hypothetical protein